jgi:uncharacterized protein (TIGR02996 family)
MAAVSNDPGMQGFFAAVREDPTDTTHQLIFADWLDERGDPRARWLRVAAKMLALEPTPTRRRTVAGLYRHVNGLPGGRQRCGLAAVALAARTPLYADEPLCVSCPADLLLSQRFILAPSAERLYLLQEAAA